MTETSELGITSIKKVTEAGPKSFDRLLVSEVGSFGLVRGCRSAFEQSGVSINVLMDSRSSEQALKEGSAIVLVTHNYIWELWSAIAALPSRHQEAAANAPEVKFICAEGPRTAQGPWEKFTFKLENAWKIPGMSVKQRIGRIINPPPPSIEQKTAVSQNAQTLVRAGMFIGSGGLLLHCPEGTQEKDKPWKGGVGAILRVANSNLKKSGTEGNIVFCSVEGIGLREYLAYRFSKLRTNKTNFWPGNSNVTVRFSEPIKISEINPDLTSEGVAQELNTRYKAWIKSTHQALQ